MLGGSLPRQLPPSNRSLLLPPESINLPEISSARNPNPPNHIEIETGEAFIAVEAAAAIDAIAASDSAMSGCVGPFLGRRRTDLDGI